MKTIQTKPDMKIRRCNNCNFVYSHAKNMATQTNICKCPNCGSNLTKENADNKN